MGEWRNWQTRRTQNPVVAILGEFDSLFAHQKMNLKEFNSLVDLFFYKATKQNPNTDFLEWLNPKNKKKYTWGETSTNIQKLAKVLKDNLARGDRCLLVSENRPEWLIADLAIMLAGGITVPAYTTYVEKIINI